MDHLRKLIKNWLVSIISIVCSTLVASVLITLINPLRTTLLLGYSPNVEQLLIAAKKPYLHVHKRLGQYVFLDIGWKPAITATPQHAQWFSILLTSVAFVNGVCKLAFVSENWRGGELLL